MRIKLDRSGKALLSHQLAEWLKAAIRRGDYVDGDILPGAVELAKAANVCERTALGALAILARDGWTETRRHIGSVVIERGLPTLCRKRLLFFTDEPYYSYYYDQIASGSRDLLLEHGIGVSTASVSCSRVGNRYLQLVEFLKEKWDLVLSAGNTRGASQVLESQGWPFVWIGDGVSRTPCSAQNCLGQVDIASGAALSKFVQACVRKGVRKVLQVMVLPRAYDAAEMLKVAEIPSQTLFVRSMGSPELVMQGGFSVVRDWFRSGGARPDVILFTDDYVAQGGLIALKGLGLGIPEDVAVVTHANKGHGPFWEKPLTRLEMDPVAHGKILAAAIAGYLRGEPFPQNLRLGSVWREGETF